MSRFITALDIRAPENDDGRWTVMAPLVYESDAAGMAITVPAGFETDLASVPRLPLVYMATGGTANAAAVIHDYLYTKHIVPRDVADAVLREASAVTRVPGWRRWAMWAAVRVFGGAAWR
ncbi:MAG: DUF1353 domain-containing protein [Azonexus sp.]|nr:DUF1353 domain-containing protein [Azonexus sp.]